MKTKIRGTLLALFLAVPALAFAVPARHTKGMAGSEVTTKVAKDKADNPCLIPSCPMAKAATR